MCICESLFCANGFLSPLLSSVYSRAKLIAKTTNQMRTQRAIRSLTPFQAPNAKRQMPCDMLHGITPREVDREAVGGFEMKLPPDSVYVGVLYGQAASGCWSQQLTISPINNCLPSIAINWSNVENMAAIGRPCLDLPTRSLEYSRFRVDSPISPSLG